MTDFDTGIARRWAQIAREDARLSTQEAAKALLALLPEPTLAEIGWDWDTHHMAGAITPQEEEVVMLWFDDDANLVICAESAWRPDELTPTGRRYKLAALNKQTAHTWYLTTAEEAEDVPEGTIIAKPGSEPYLMDDDLGWITPSGAYTHEHVVENLPWCVLRWGWAL